ncbi:MAG: hypothetical protein Q8935_04355 [Bacillota bacterium]|nr:hypothetical protein [Bacillota bacterium]MDP4154336.1 hypothetical protein [Bacillota bacterium]
MTNGNTDTGASLGFYFSCSISAKLRLPWGKAGKKYSLSVNTNIAGNSD